MTENDPFPRPSTDRERAAAAWAQHMRTMRWMAPIAAVAVALSLAHLSRAGGPMPIHLPIAMVAGLGLTMLVGTGLMGLAFLSRRSGDDDDAAHGGQDDDAR